MSIERFDLIPGPDGREQFAMIERRPTRAQLKAIEIATRRALRSDQAMDGEDGLLMALVSEWTVYDAKGETVPLRIGAALDRVPADVLAPLVNELSGVVAAVDRGTAMSQITATLTNMSWTLEEAKAKRVKDITDELHLIYGVTPPNRETQA